MKKLKEKLEMMNEKLRSGYEVDMQEYNDVRKQVRDIQLAEIGWDSKSGEMPF